MADLQKIFISFVIPAYNAEKTISRTINSILQQSDCDFEIVVIDDGSSDNTIKIIEQASANDKKINFFTIPNSGPLKARLEGVKKANGEFIAFVDSDDCVSPEYVYNIKKSYEKDVSIDVFVIDMLGITGAKHSRYLYTLPCEKEFIVPYEFIEYLLDGKLGYSSLKVYKREIFKTVLDNPTFINEDIRLGEDLVLSLKLFNTNQKIRYLKQPLYYYFINQNSISNSHSLKQAIYCLKLLDYKYDYLANNNYTNDVIKIKLKSTFFHFLIILSKLNKKEREEAENMLLTNKTFRDLFNNKRSLLNYFSFKERMALLLSGFKAKMRG